MCLKQCQHTFSKARCRSVVKAKCMDCLRLTWHSCTSMALAYRNLRAICGQHPFTGSSLATKNKQIQPGANYCAKDLSAQPRLPHLATPRRQEFKQRRKMDRQPSEAASCMRWKVTHLHWSSVSRRRVSWPLHTHIHTSNAFMSRALDIFWHRQIKGKQRNQMKSSRLF